MIYTNLNRYLIESRSNSLAIGSNSITNQINKLKIYKKKNKDRNNKRKWVNKQSVIRNYVGDTPNTSRSKLPNSTTTTTTTLTTAANE